MLHPVLRLQTDAQGFRLEVTRLRSLRPTVVVPREICLFESVPSAGVAWHERPGFARVQAMRLAPFAQSGGSAALRGKRLMLWFWDDAEIDPVIREAGLDPGSVRKIAETLMLDVPRAGSEVRLGCSGGIDTLTMVSGAIIRSTWSAGSDLPVKLLRRPWSRNVLSLSSGRDVATSAPAWSMPQVLALASVAAIVGCAGYAAYWGGTLLGAQSRLARLETDAQATSSRLGDVGQWRQAQKADAAWVDAYRRLGASLDVPALLAALQRPLEAHGVVIRELEVRNEETRVLLTSVGAEIDLPGLLERLAAVPGVEDVQLRQNADPLQATYTMRTPGFRSVDLGESAVTR